MIRYITYTIILYLLISCPLSLYSKEPETFIVVIDAGHGGKDVGAVDNGAKEKDINLGVAKKLSGMIKKNLKNVKPILTRENDTYLTLQERAAIANKNKGNLFISIHTNSVDKTNSNRANIQGASVYALGLHKDQNNLQVARRENSVIELESNFEQKYSGFDPSKDESYIIFEMAQKHNLSQSLKFANLAQKNLVSLAGRADKGVKQAGFWVLWATSMPSVLVELDFICNPKSAEFLNSEKGQEKLAKALCAALEKYFGTNKNSYTSETEDNTDIKASSNMPPVLAPSEEENKKINYSSNNKIVSSQLPRKRRSLSARKLSDARAVEADDIKLHTENERMAVAQPASVALESVQEASYNDSFSGSKKSKTNIIEKTSGGKTTYKVQSSKYKPRQSHIHKVYKIQVLASSELLKQNNPRFCGLTPIKSFKERGLYKYTYGESSDKSEIEKLLSDVRKKIPDAFIITNIK